VVIFIRYFVSDMKKNYLFLLLLMLSSTIYSQHSTSQEEDTFSVERLEASTSEGANDFSSTQNAKKSLQHAQTLVNQGKLKTARKQLEHTIKIKDNFAVAHRELGMVNLEMGFNEDAIRAFEASFDLDEKLSRAAFFECGEAYFRLGQADMARYYYTKFTELKNKSYANKQKESGLEIDYDLLLEERLNNCKYIEKVAASSNSITPAEALPISINSEVDDFLPTVSNAGDLMIFTRTDRKGNQNIFRSEQVESKWTKARPFGKEINTNKNEGMAKLEAHGKQFYFTGCFRPDTEGGCDIYQAIFQNQKINETQKLTGSLNGTEWDSQPSITCDGQNLYFTSNREGGHGGADLWMSIKNTDGSWSEATNLGPSVNTSGDEEAPYISNDGNTLFFTSTGHPGQGSGDLFISRKNKEVWTAPKNLDYPFNSPGKEIGFFLHADGKTAYFSSARVGGKGGLDIYSVELPEQYRPDPTILLEGQVVDQVSNEPVPSYIKISREEEHRYVQTNETGGFFLCLPGNKGYSFQINEPGYDYFIDARFVAATGHLDPAKALLKLKPKQITAKLVSKKTTSQKEEKRVQFFFASDSYSLTHDDLLELETLAKTLKKKRTWSAEVIGYADGSGSKDYNKWISEQRAQKIMSYLRAQGVDSDQIVKLEGKGATTSKDDSAQMRRVDVVLYGE
jgi:Outer membrane protein and related peptidoglycan-associated (lipo)proteins